MITYWETLDNSGRATWHFENTVYGNFDLKSESVTKGRVDLFGIAYVGGRAGRVDVTYPDGQKKSFEGYTDNGEIITAIKRFFNRGPGEMLVDSRIR